MRIKTISRRSNAAQEKPYVGVAVATLLLTLILGSFTGVPRVSASSGSIERGIDATAARYQAMGLAYAATAVYSDEGIQRGIDADAARYQAMGEFYLATSVARGIAADTARYQAMGTAYTAAARDLLAANPELMFARRAYRAPASLLALNPELMAARQSYSAPASLLAVNPELMVARRSYRAAVSLLAANPELMVARRAYNRGDFSCSPRIDRLAENPELRLLSQLGHC